MRFALIAAALSLFLIPNTSQAEVWIVRAEASTLSSVKFHCVTDRPGPTPQAWAEDADGLVAGHGFGIGGAEFEVSANTNLVPYQPFELYFVEVSVGLDSTWAAFMIMPSMSGFGYDVMVTPL